MSRWGPVLGLALAACAPSAPLDGSAIELPPGFPALPAPAKNPLTVEKIELGRHLFHDVRLSGNQAIACADCHQQRLAFTDGLPRAVGGTGQAHPRNSQSLTNAAYNATLTWANPGLVDLETQILIPLFGEEPVEMGADAGALARVTTAGPYPALFAAAWPEVAEPGWDEVVGALASYTRALVSGRSRVDALTHGQSDALSSSEINGMNLFFSERLECHHCHGGFNFSASSVHADSAFEAALFHNTGLYDLGEGAYPADNTGVYEITGEPTDMGRFRPPSLRNVALTAPYLHDGSAATLDEVVRLYEAGGRLIEAGPYAGDGRLNPYKSPLVPGFSLTGTERDDLIAFLAALTDTELLTDPTLGDPW